MASQKEVTVKVRYTADLSDLNNQMKTLMNQSYKVNINDRGAIESLTKLQNANKDFIKSMTGEVTMTGAKRGYDDIQKSIAVTRDSLSGLIAETRKFYDSADNKKNLEALTKYEKQVDDITQKIKEWDKYHGKNGLLANFRETNKVSSRKNERESEMRNLEAAKDDALAINNQKELDNIEARLQVLRDYITLLKEAPDTNKGVLQEQFKIATGEAREASSLAMTKDELTETISLYDQIIKYVNRYGTEALSVFNLTTSEIDKQTKELDEAQKGTQNLINTFSGTFLGVSLSGLTSKIYRESIDFYKQMDALLTRTMMVTGQTREEVNGLTESYSKMAKQLSSTVKDVAAAQLVFYQQGLATKEAALMTEAAIGLSKTGGIAAEEAANRLTAAIKGYQLAATDALDVTDKMSALDAKAASSVDELSVALSKVASQAKMAGMDLDYLMAYLSTMQEVTREAPENIGTAMKSVIARFQELKDIGKIEEDGTSFSNVAKALNEVGIAAVDASGQLRPMNDIFIELGDKWQYLDQNHKAYLATVMAGNRQQSRFVALMDNYDRALDLVSVSQNASGETARQLRAYNSGLEASFQRLGNAWQEFATRIADSSTISGLVRTIAKFVEVINSLPKGLIQTVTYMTLLTKGMKALNMVTAAMKMPGSKGQLLKDFLGVDSEWVKSLPKQVEKGLSGIEGTFRKVFSKSGKIITEEITDGLDNAVSGINNLTTNTSKLNEVGKEYKLTTQGIVTAQQMQTGAMAGQTVITGKYADVAEGAAGAVGSIGANVNLTKKAMDDDNATMAQQINDTSKLLAISTNKGQIAEMTQDLARAQAKLAETKQSIRELPNLRQKNLTAYFEEVATKQPVEYQKYRRDYKSLYDRQSKKMASGQDSLFPQLSYEEGFQEYLRNRLPAINARMDDVDRDFELIGNELQKSKAALAEYIKAQKSAVASAQGVVEADKIKIGATEQASQAELAEAAASQEAALADTKEAVASEQAAIADRNEALTKIKNNNNLSKLAINPNGLSNLAGGGTLTTSGALEATAKNLDTSSLTIVDPSLAQRAGQTTKSIINLTKNLKLGEKAGQAFGGVMTGMMVSMVAQMVGADEQLSSTLGTFAGFIQAGFKMGGALGAGIGAVAAIAITAWKSVDNAAASAQAALDKANDEFARTSEAYQSIKNLAGEYFELARKINKTAEEQEKLNSLTAELAELAPKAVVGYDTSGNAILDASKIDEAVETKREKNAEKSREVVDKAIANANKQAAKEIDTTYRKVERTTGTLIVGAGGAAAGMAAGAALGSVVPVVGTIIGAAIGGLIGWGTSRAMQKEMQKSEKAAALGKALQEQSKDVIKGITEQNINSIAEGSADGLKAREELSAYMISDSYTKFSEELVKKQKKKSLSDKEIKKMTESYQNEMDTAFAQLADIGGLDRIASITADMATELDKGESWSKITDTFNKQLNAVFANAGIDEETAAKLRDGIIDKIFVGKTNTKRLQDEIQTIIDNYAAAGTDTSGMETLKNMIPQMNQTTVDTIGASGLFADIKGNEEILKNLGDDIDGINLASRNLDGTLNTSAATFQLTAALFGDIDDSMDKETVDKYHEAIKKLMSTLESPVNPSFAEISELVSSNLEDFNTLIGVIENLNETGGRMDLENFTALLGTLDAIEDAMYNDLSAMEMYGSAFEQLANNISVVDGELRVQAEGVNALAEVKRLAFLAEIKQLQSEVEMQIQAKEFEQQMLIAQRDALIAGLELQGTAAEKEAAIEESLKNNLADLNNQWLDNEAAAAASFVALNSTAVSEVVTMYAKLAKARASGDYSQLTDMEDSAANIYAGLQEKLISNVKVSLDLTKQGDVNKVLREGIDALNNSIRLSEEELKILKSKQVMLSSLAEVAEAGNGALAKFSKGQAKAADEYIGKLEETFTLLQKIAGLEHKISKLREKQGLYEGRDGAKYAERLLDELEISQEKYEVQKDLFALEQRILQDQASMMKSSEYGNLFTFFEDGTMALDWAAYSKLSGDAAETVDNWVGEYENLQDQLRETDLALYEHAQLLKEIQAEYVDLYQTAENTILEAVKNREQILHDARIKALEDEIDMIQQAADARNKARDDRKDEKELYQSQEALRRAMLDTSGKNNSELLKLQEELEEKQLEISEKRFDQDLEDRMDWLQDTKDAETETYEYRLEKMTWYWEEVAVIMDSGTEQILAFLRQYDAEYLTESDFTQQQIEIGWQATFTALQTMFDSGVDFNHLETGLQNITSELETIDIRIQAVTSDAWKAVAALNSVTTASNNASSSTSSTTSSKNASGTSTTNVTASSEGEVLPTTVTATGAKFVVGDSVRSAEQVRDGGINQVRTYKLDANNNPSSGLFNWEFGWSSKNKISEVKKGSDGKYYYKVSPFSSGYFREDGLIYKQGGYVDYTGPAWVDGTKSQPEAFLSAYQTKQVGALAEALDTNSINSTNFGGDVTIENISFNVASMSNEADGRKALNVFVAEANNLMAKKGIGTRLSL